MVMVCVGRTHCLQPLFKYWPVVDRLGPGVLEKAGSIHRSSPFLTETLSPWQVSNLVS